MPHRPKSRLPRPSVSAPLPSLSSSRTQRPQQLRFLIILRIRPHDPNKARLLLIVPYRALEMPQQVRDRDARHRDAGAELGGCGEGARRWWDGGGRWGGWI